MRDEDTEYDEEREKVKEIYESAIKIFPFISIIYYLVERENLLHELYNDISKLRRAFSGFKEDVEYMMAKLNFEFV